MVRTRIRDIIAKLLLDIYIMYIYIVHSASLKIPDFNYPVIVFRKLVDLFLFKNIIG